MSIFLIQDKGTKHFIWLKKGRDYIYERYSLSPTPPNLNARIFKEAIMGILSQATDVALLQYLAFHP